VRQSSSLVQAPGFVGEDAGATAVADAGADADADGIATAAPSCASFAGVLHASANANSADDARDRFERIMDGAEKATIRSTVSSAQGFVVHELS
jgi:hypothetical protein